VTDQTSSTAQPQEKEPRAIATASSGAFNGAAHDGTAVPNDIQWATLAGHERLLLGGVPTLSMREMAERAGTSLALARRFWRAMGFADVEPDEVRFTDNDVDALRIGSKRHVIKKCSIFDLFLRFRRRNIIINVCVKRIFVERVEIGHRFQNTAERFEYGEHLNTADAVHRIAFVEFYGDTPQ